MSCSFLPDLEVVERLERGDGDLADDVLWDALPQLLVDELVELVCGGGHQLHADPAVALLEDGAEEEHDEGAVVGAHHYVLQGRVRKKDLRALKEPLLLL